MIPISQEQSASILFFLQEEDHRLIIAELSFVFHSGRKALNYNVCAWAAFQGAKDIRMNNTFPDSHLRDHYGVRLFRELCQRVGSVLNGIRLRHEH